jgi:hypothetical protein
MFFSLVFGPHKLRFWLVLSWQMSDRCQPQNQLQKPLTVFRLYWSRFELEMSSYLEPGPNCYPSDGSSVHRWAPCPTASILPGRRNQELGLVQPFECGNSWNKGIQKIRKNQLNALNKMVLSTQFVKQYFLIFENTVLWKTQRIVKGPFGCHWFCILNF